MTVRSLAACPVCGFTGPSDSLPMADAVAAHLVRQAEASDVQHVMWLNRNVTKHRVSVDALAGLLRDWEAGALLPGDRVER